MDEPLLQSADVALLLRLTPDGVRRASREGRLRVAMTTGRGTKLYRRADVEAFARGRDERAAQAKTRALRGRRRW